jgi:hypothetical protein
MERHHFYKKSSLKVINLICVCAGDGTNVDNSSNKRERIVYAAHKCSLLVVGLCGGIRRCLISRKGMAVLYFQKIQPLQV